MDEEEQEDLLIHESDSESALDDPETYRVISCPLIEERCENCCCYRKRIEFLITGFLCLVSATALLVLLPLYVESANQVANVYTSLLFTSLATTIITFVLACIVSKLRIFASSSFKPPFPLWRLAQAGCLQGLGALCVIYAVDRQRVLCHIQDPIKAVTLIFSLVYYFFFSKKIMGLQKIFCATTVIVGLFVSVDYALCDEFHCRGYAREKIEDDAGQWSHFTHFFWILNYTGGLALWTMHFSVLEADVVGLYLKNPLAHTHRRSLLETISCVVSTQDRIPGPSSPNGNDNTQHCSNRQGSFSTYNQCSVAEPGKQRNSAVDETRNMLDNPRSAPQSAHLNSPSTIAIVLWVNLFSVLLIMLFFWTDLVPSIGKSASWSDFMNLTRSGIFCHFKTHSSVIGVPSWFNSTSETTAKCSSVACYGWLFIASLLIFVLSAYHFLVLSQSSVFTVALTTSALPFGNIFWSLFRLIPISGGIIEWSPNVTAELVCSLLGIPIICTGLVLLCRTHWTNNTVQKELCCTLRYHPQANST